MVLDLDQLVCGLGFRSRRLLMTGEGRAVAQVELRAGQLFAAKVDSDPSAFVGDVTSIELLRAAGLPVPDIVAHTAGPPAVLILTWIEGDPISSATPVAAQREAGHLLRIVHALPGGPPYSGQPGVAGWITAWTVEVAGWWPSVGGTSDQVARLMDWLADLAPVLSGRTGSLTLFDGRAEHVLVRGERVAGLIDLHDVGSGDPAMDLAVLTLTDKGMLPAVLDGYAPGRGELATLTQLIPFYWVLRALAGAEWCLRVGDQAEGARLLRLAETGIERKVLRWSASD